MVSQQNTGKMAREKYLTEKVAPMKNFGDHPLCIEVPGDHAIHHRPGGDGSQQIGFAVLHGFVEETRSRARTQNLVARQHPGLLFLFVVLSQFGDAIEDSGPVTAPDVVHSM